jgi:hypothetical protein
MIFPKPSITESPTAGEDSLILNILSFRLKQTTLDGLDADNKLAY